MDNPPFVPKLKTLVPYLKANPPSDRQRNVLLAQYAPPNHVLRTGAARPRKIAGKIDFVMSVPPKAWNKLEGKPAHEIVRSVCLASYSMLMRT